MFEPHMGNSWIRNQLTIYSRNHDFKTPLKIEETS